jgi:hypothetical protein
MVFGIESVVKSATKIQRPAPNTVKSYQSQFQKKTNNAQHIFLRRH